MNWKRFNKSFKLIAASLVLSASLLPGTVSAQDPTVDRFLYTDQNINSGRGVSQSANGGSLAWGESYYLDSYITMYESTRSQYWLDKIVDHSDRILSNASDHDGDGALGWKDHGAAYNQAKNNTFTIQGSSSYSTSVVTNGSFEQDTDSDSIPDGWTIQGATAKAYRSISSDAAFDGLAGVIIESDGIHTNKLVQSISLAPSLTYLVELYMSVDTEKTQAMVEMINPATNAVLGSVRAYHVGYDRYMFEFRAPSTGEVALHLGLQNYEQADYKAYFDHVRVTAINDTKPAIVNGDMEKLHPADSTMPEGWSRVGTANSSTVNHVVDPITGSNVLATTTDNTTWKIAEQTFDYVPSQTYTLTFDGKIAGSGGLGRVQIYNATDASVIAYTTITSTSWSSGSLSFTAPNTAGKELKIRLYQTNWAATGLTTYYDNIVLSELSPLTNGDMEILDPTDSTLPSNWIRSGAATSASIYVSTDASTGSYSLVTTTDNTVRKIAEQNLGAYIPSQTYTLSFDGKVSTLDASGVITIYNATDSTTIASTSFRSTSWNTFKLSFVAPATLGKQLKIRVYQNKWDLIGFSTYLDNVKLYTSNPINTLLNTGFETADTTDPTMALNWTRLSGTTTSDAFLSSGINNYYTGQKGFSITSSPSSIKGIEQTIHYKPGETYDLTYYGRTTDSRVANTMEIYNETDNVQLATHSFNGTRWTKQALQFTAPNELGKTIKIRYTQPMSLTATAYIDLISLSPKLPSEAAGWTRTSTTSLSEAHRATDSLMFADDIGLKLDYLDSTPPVIYQELYNYEPLVEYGISFSASASAGAVGQVRVVDRTTSSLLGSWNFNNTGKLTVKEGIFNTPAAGHDLVVEVSIPTGSIGDTVWLDTFEIGQQWEHMVHDGTIMSPILRFVNIVLADPALHASYLSKAEMYRDFAANNLFDKWEPYWRQITGTDGDNNGTGVYIIPPGLSTKQFPGRSLPHNQYLAFSQMLYLLHDATEGVSAYSSIRPVYLSRANDMARAFKSTLIDHPLNTTLSTDAYRWNYWDYFGPWDDGHYASYTQEDLSHAGLTMAGVVEAYHQGEVFTAYDMEKLTNTFTDIMWNQSLTDPVMSYYNGRQPLVTTDKINTRNYHFWGHFAEFDPLVADITNAICEIDGCATVMASSLTKWSGNKLHNTNFELVDALDSTLPQQWTRFLSNSTTARLDSSDPGMNDSSLLITNNGTSWQIIEQQLTDYEPNTPYTISFLSKKYGATNGRVQLYDYTTSTNLGQLVVSNTNWARSQFTVTTPEAGHDIRIRFYTTAVTPSGASVGFDDVHAFPALASTEIANAGFETPDSLDPMLPRYWGRGASTTAANVTLDSTNAYAGLNSLKIDSSADGNNQEIHYSWSGYRPDTAYTVSLTAKVSGSAGGKLKIINTNTNTVLINQSITSTSWDTTTITFTTPTAYNDKLTLIFTHEDPSSSGSLWLDQILVTK